MNFDIQFTTNISFYPTFPGVSKFQEDDSR